jgi:hypothetical protein
MEVAIDPDEPVTFAVLGDDAQTSVPAHVISVSGRRLKLSAATSPGAGAAVEIRSRQYLLLSEVADVNHETGVMTLSIRHAFKLADIDAIQQRWK